ncbi:hypothetical protein [Motilimonas eburnea]|uniref:hypothetical protein n=1 Tax=Motilimonas eburnea TaxID=1737488 RepID=UPI001E5D1300|nr:hypothetical protein [Motilimonas eburnea]MCE2570051.1 hypothetical protein [Motilimonas eburnea]
MYLILALIFIVIVAALCWFDDSLPKQYRRRVCMGRRWKQAFPAAKKQDMRRFLTDFTLAFAFDEKDKLQFAPTDKILDIYRALYPKKWMPDSLEIETLAEDMAVKYQVKLEGIWYDDLTLGELYLATQPGKSAVALGHCQLSK